MKTFRWDDKDTAPDGWFIITDRYMFKAFIRIGSEWAAGYRWQTDIPITKEFGAFEIEKGDLDYTESEIVRMNEYHKEVAMCRAYATIKRKGDIGNGEYGADGRRDSYYGPHDGKWNGRYKPDLTDEQRMMLGFK